MTIRLGRLSPVLKMEESFVANKRVSARSRRRPASHNLELERKRELGGKLKKHTLNYGRIGLGALRFFV
jgi:hypothetical protein